MLKFSFVLCFINEILLRKILKGCERPKALLVKKVNWGDTRRYCTQVGLLIPFELQDTTLNTYTN